jgi:large subunit ribosomal protein L21
MLLMTYAIIESGGKQYRVQPGDTIEVEKLKVEPGASVDLERVLLLSDNDKITIGQPTVPGVKVVANVEEHGRGEKIVVLKYKRKIRYSVKQGHRQSFTRLNIRDIVTGATKAAATTKATATPEAAKAPRASKASAAPKAPKATAAKPVRRRITSRSKDDGTQKSGG